MSNEEDEGLSTTQKVVAGTALGVAIPAAVGVARKLMGSEDDESSGERESGQQRRTTGSRGRAKTKTKTANARRKTKSKAASKTRSAA